MIPNTGNIGQQRTTIPNIDSLHFRPLSSNFEKWRPEVANDVISSLAVDRSAWMSVQYFGDFMLNTGRVLPAAPVLRTFVQYLVAIDSRPETASEVIFGMFWGRLSPIGV